MLALHVMLSKETQLLLESSVTIIEADLFHALV
jgi:hypothetical protein